MWECDSVTLSFTYLSFKLEYTAKTQQISTPNPPHYFNKWVLPLTMQSVSPEEKKNVLLGNSLSTRTFDSKKKKKAWERSKFHS